MQPRPQVRCVACSSGRLSDSAASFVRRGASKDRVQDAGRTDRHQQTASHRVRARQRPAGTKAAGRHRPRTTAGAPSHTRQQRGPATGLGRTPRCRSAEPSAGPRPSSRQSPEPPAAGSRIGCGACSGGAGRSYGRGSPEPPGSSNMRSTADPGFVTVRTDRWTFLIGFGVRALTGLATLPTVRRAFLIGFGASSRHNRPTVPPPRRRTRSGGPSVAPSTPLRGRAGSTRTSGRVKIYSPSTYPDSPSTRGSRQCFRHAAP